MSHIVDRGSIHRMSFLPVDATGNCYLPCAVQLFGMDGNGNYYFVNEPIEFNKTPAAYLDPSVNIDAWRDAELRGMRRLKGMGAVSLTNGHPL